jgi:hypothetical protein
MVVKRLSTIEGPNSKYMFVGNKKNTKSILKEIGSFTSGDLSHKKEVIHHDTQLMGFKSRMKKNKTMNDFERSEQKNLFLQSYNDCYKTRFKPYHDQYRYNLAKVMTKTFETSIGSPVSATTDPDHLGRDTHLLYSPGNRTTNRPSNLSDRIVIEDNKNAYIPVNNSIKMIINLPKDPLLKAGLDRTPVSPHPMVTDKKYQTQRPLRNKASMETINDFAKTRPTVSSFKKHDNSLPKLSPMKTTTKMKVKNDKVEFLDKFDEKPPAPFLAEGLGLLALHSTRHSKLGLTEDFKPENFKIPISTLSILVFF